jgi:hypothetical protein
VSKTFNLEAEMREYAARRDITDAAHRYMRGLDRLDPALLRSAFHDDALIDVGLNADGVDGYVAFCMELLAGFSGTQHLMGQVRIEFHDEASASGEIYFQAWHGSQDEAGSPRDLFISGRYVDEYACNNGEWRIAKRKLITDWVKDDAANPSFLNANPSILRSGRKGEDFSEIRNWSR